MDNIPGRNPRSTADPPHLSSRFSDQIEKSFRCGRVTVVVGAKFHGYCPVHQRRQKPGVELLGGVTGREADYGYHDWEFILNEIGLLRYDQPLAAMAYGFGIVLMLASFAWAGVVLLKQYKRLHLT